MPTTLRQNDQALALLYHARSATLFCSADGEACASIPAAIDSRQVLPIRSAAFRDWLTANFYGEYETAPSATAFRAALRTLEARARYGEAPAQKVDRRLSFEGDPFTPSKVILDLANASGELLEITSKGWRTTDNLHHSFRQFSATLALPRPEAPANGHQPLQDFAKLFRLTGANRARALIWLASALRPVGPYPVLVIRGRVSTGKSILARALRALIDPSAAPVRRLPNRDHELLQLAFQNWMLVFDQVHRIPSKISEAVCAISSGDAFEVAQPDYRDPLVFQVARPIALIVPDDETRSAWTPPRTLSSRTLTIELPRIATLRPESAVWADFEALRSSLVAVLADSVATAMHRIREIDLGNVARFPDCAAWAAAASPVLGLSESDIVQALSDSEATWAGSYPLRDALHALLENTGTWTGNPTALLTELHAIAPLAALPRTARGLSQVLPSVPGIRVEKGRASGGDRNLVLTAAGANRTRVIRNAPGIEITP
jgi:putative DNA primase/helicase